MALLIFYVLLALGVSFLCSIMEAVLLSLTPSFVAATRQRDNTLGTRLYELKQDIDRPLAAILSLNTIAHTVGAAGAGAQAAKVFGSASLGVISGILTLLILVFSEIIPKTLGASYWRQLAPLVARLLVPTIWLLWPLVKLSQLLTRLLSRGEKTTTVSREEFTALAHLGEEEGVFEEDESRILKSLFRFRSLRARDVMTPRTVVFALHEERTAAELVEMADTLRFSRILLFCENRDDIRGYVLKDDALLKAAQDDAQVKLKTLKRELLTVPEMLPLPTVFERLLDRLEHIALVVDEYGGMAGIVTMEDVIETLLGMEIVDEADSAEDMQELARQQWYKRARRLGVISEETDEDVVRYSITGNAPPQKPKVPARTPPDERP